MIQFFSAFDFIVRVFSVCFWFYCDKLILILKSYFRQSIDLYSSVPSPNIGFLGNSSLSRFGSSFLSSSLTQRHAAEVTKPLLPTAVDGQHHHHQRHSSHSLLPPVQSRKSSILRKADSEHKPSAFSHEFHGSRNSSFGQAVINGEHRNYLTSWINLFVFVLFVGYICVRWWRYLCMDYMRTNLKSFLYHRIYDNPVACNLFFELW